MTRSEKCWGIYRGKGLVQAIFEPNFSRIIPQHRSKIVVLYTYLLMKMEQTECSEMSAYKIQTPGN
jgi:hypothetical protein